MTLMIKQPKLRAMLASAAGRCLGVAGVLVSTLTLGACASGTRGQTPPKDRSSIETRTLNDTHADRALTPYEQLDAATQLRGAAAGDEHFATVKYLGGARFSIFRNDETATAMRSRYVAAVPSTVQLTFRRALLSAAQISKISSVVAADEPKLIKQGVRIQSYGGNAPGQFVIGYLGSKRPDSQLLEPYQVFGPNTVVFAHETPVTTNAANKAQPSSSPDRASRRPSLSANVSR